MTLSSYQCKQIEATVVQVVEKKLASYQPETPDEKPFHHRILGKDRMALFSFIHSMNTVMGTSVFEKVASLIAKPFFQQVENGYQLPQRIGQAAEYKITELMNHLKNSQQEPDIQKESQALWEVRHQGPFYQKKIRKVDLFLMDKQNKVYFFDIKTAKPNIDGFEKLKQNTLEWIACYYGQLDSSAPKELTAGVAIPYNPYAPKPYKRWTLRGMFAENQLLVGEDFWNFLAGNQPIYQQLLDCFERAGEVLRAKVDNFFGQFQQG